MEQQTVRQQADVRQVGGGLTRPASPPLILAVLHGAQSATQGHFRPRVVMIGEIQQTR